MVLLALLIGDCACDDVIPVWPSSPLYTTELHIGIQLDIELSWHTYYMVNRSLFPS